MSATVPKATISPPSLPAPGPTSTTESALRIVLSSCSMTITVFPRSRRRSRVSKSLSASRGWSPTDGSSSTYVTPARYEPICAASLTRWYSPPESEAAERDNVRYDSPTSSRKPSLLSASLTSPAPIRRSRSSGLYFLRNAARSLTGIADNSPILLSPIFIARASRLSLIPPHSGHTPERMKLLYLSRTRSDSVLSSLSFIIEDNPGNLAVANFHLP